MEKTQLQKSHATVPIMAVSYVLIKCMHIVFVENA